MFELMLATLLAQATPAAEITPVPSALANPTDDGRRTFPEGPRRLPFQTPKMTTGDVLVRDSGSTNFAGYVFVVHTDGTADVADGQGGTTRKPVGAPQTKWLFAKLRSDMPLSALASARCMKSASFGTTTTITYQGQTAGDLSCGGGPEAHELYRTIGVIAGQLGLTGQRSGRSLRDRM